MGKNSKDIRSFFGGAAKAAKPDIRGFLGKGRLRRNKDATEEPAVVSPPDKKEPRGEEANNNEPLAPPAEEGKHLAPPAEEGNEPLAPRAEEGNVAPPAEEGKEEQAEERAAKKAKVPVAYSVFAETCQKVECETKRLVITDIVKKLLMVVLHDPDDLACILYLLEHKVAPAFENVELGIGDALLFKAVAQSCGKNVPQIKEAAKKKGDLGAAAEAARATQKTLTFGAKPPPLTAQKVLDEFRNIAKVSGSKSQDQKIGRIAKLLAAATPVEAKYLIRALSGKMRIRCGLKTILVALAHATGHKNVEEAESIVKTCYAEHPVMDDLAKAAATLPITRWRELCSLSVGVPVEPMCAKAEKEVSAVLKRFQNVAFTCEHKYDGERLQAHCDNGVVRLFSRNSADTTKKWPDVVEYVTKAARCQKFILDAEVVAVDKTSGDLLPFQILSTRKKETTLKEITVPVVVVAFDLLYCEEPLLQEPLRTRRERLLQSFTPFTNDFRFATSVDVESDGETIIQEAMEHAITAKVEGLMIKTLDSNATYEPQKRSLNWLKLKKDYLDSFMGDSFDLVVVGGYHGKGKRTGTFGSYLLACYEPDDGLFQSVCKVATGLSDEELKENDALFQPIVVAARPRHVVVGDGLCEGITWFQPKYLFEVRCADLSLSSTHKGALDKINPGRGVGLRFPRYERRRDDKDPEQATTSKQVLDMYLDQDSVKHAAMDEDDDDDDLL